MSIAVRNQHSCNEVRQAPEKPPEPPKPTLQLAKRGEGPSSSPNSPKWPPVKEEARAPLTLAADGQVIIAQVCGAILEVDGIVVVQLDSNGSLACPGKVIIFLLRAA